MLDADHLRIVFQVKGVSFVMPVAQLLAIRGPDEYTLTVHQDLSSLQLGVVDYRGAEVAIYNFAAVFDLPDSSLGSEGQLLIFSGTDRPWAICVDNVGDVFDVADFEFIDLPTYILRDNATPYQQVAEYAGQLLVSLDARQLEQAWDGLQ